MPTTSLQIIRDVSGVASYIIRVTNSKAAGVLATSNPATVTVPTEGSAQYGAIFSYEAGSNVWVNFVGTAARPTTESEVTDSELNPQGRVVDSGASISLITEDAAGAAYSIIFYEIQAQ